MHLLNIQNLQASASDKQVLKGLDLTINPGEVHAIMGPNGSGKSTLSKVLTGHPGYEVTGGEVNYQGKDLLALDPEERAHAGVFLGFQYPVEIPGVSNVNLLRASYNAIQVANGKPELDAMDFLALVKENAALVEMDQDLIYRDVNSGFSGGEKKRNEVLQMLVLKPDLIILDEIDSGLDIDALQCVSKGVNALRHADRSVLLITHYQRLLKHITPDYIHVLANGRIIKSGDKTLGDEIEAKGYGWLLEQAAEEN